MSGLFEAPPLASSMPLSKGPSFTAAPPPTRLVEGPRPEVLATLEKTVAALIDTHTGAVVSDGAEAISSAGPSSAIMSALLDAVSPPFAAALCARSAVDGQYYSFPNPPTIRKNSLSLPSLTAAITAFEGGDASSDAEQHTSYDVCKRILPFIAKAAAQYYDLFPSDGEGDAEKPIEGITTRLEELTSQTATDSPSRTVSLSKAQCLCIVACSFLCLFPRLAYHGGSVVPCMVPVSDDDVDEDDAAGKFPAGEQPSIAEGPMPTINCDELFAAAPQGVEVAKLHMLLLYFSEMERRYQSGFGFTAEERKRRSEGVDTLVADHSGPSLIFIRNALAKGQFFFDEEEGPSADSAATASSILPAPTATAGAGDSVLPSPPPPSALRPLLRPPKPLAPFVLAPLKESIDDQHDVLRVDFANMTIGGGAMSYGCVQEEITFALCPELIATRLMMGDMGDREAIVMLGAEQFALLKEGTYGYSMACDGAVPHPEEMFVTSCSSSIVAVDALDYRGSRRNGGGGRAQQYRIKSITREMVKLTAGLAIGHLGARVASLVAHKRALVGDALVSGLGESPAGDKSIVATGNWGCGVFLGDVEAKSLLQWLVCCEVGKTMHYYPFDTERLRVLEQLAPQLIQKGVTAAQLYGFLGTVYKRGLALAKAGQRTISVFKLLAEEFGLTMPQQEGEVKEAVAPTATAATQSQKDSGDTTETEADE